MSTATIPMTRPETLSSPETHEPEILNTDQPETKPESVSEAITDPPPDAGRDQVLQHVLELNERVIFYRESMGNWKAEQTALQQEISALKESASELENQIKEAKDTIREMQNAITDKLHSLAQGQIFMQFDGTGTAPGTTQDNNRFDPATQDGIELLKLTPSITEKLRGADVETVADLEAKICSGKLQYISGIGQAAVDKISDAVLEYREHNPVPDEDETEET